jgi:Zn-dependent peptidase ImmA (M78 family)
MCKAQIFKGLGARRLPEYTMNRKQAEAEAEALIDSEWSGRGLPIDPSYIARRLGAEVYTVALQDEVDAMLKYFEAGNTPAILVSSSSALVRQRFSVAHELGHFVLNQRLHPEGNFTETDVFYRNPDSSTAKSPAEIFANQFGAALLMPARFVRVLIDSGKSDLIMANDFGVSLEAMGHRLTNLGLTPRSPSY